MTDRFRVTLPKDARRPHQILTGLRGYPRLTFDALTPAKFPKNTKKKVLPRATVDQLIETGGQPFLTYLRQAMRRDGIEETPGEHPFDHVPGSLYPELLAQVEVASSATSKWLLLSPDEVRDLLALGFLVDPEDATETPTDPPSETEKQES